MFPAGVVQSVAAFACKPVAVEVDAKTPEDAITVGPTVEFNPSASEKGCGSNVQAARTAAPAGRAPREERTNIPARIFLEFMILALN
jgi:hypothetical protein